MMRAALPWTIAACLAALAPVARAPVVDTPRPRSEVEQRSLQLINGMGECCTTTRKTLTLFNYDGDTGCKEKFLAERWEAQQAQQAGDRTVRVPEATDGCTLQCVFESHKLLNKDGSVDEQKLRDRYLEDAENRAKDVNDVIVAGLDRCFKLAKNKAPLREAAVKEDSAKRQCKLEPQIFLGCFTMKLVRNCPATDWTNSADCIRTREEFKSDARWKPEPVADAGQEQ